MALLLQAAFPVLVKAVVFGLNRQFFMEAAYLTAPVVGSQRGTVTPAPLREFGRRHHARCEIAILVIAQLLRADRSQAGNQHQFVGRRSSEEHTSELQSLMRISYAVF